MAIKRVAIALASFALSGCVSQNLGPMTYNSRADSIIQLTALSGRPLSLYFTVELNPDCTWRSDPVIQVLEAPANGSATVTNARDYPNYRRPSDRVACNRTKHDGKRLTYQPNPGFVGIDNVLIDSISSNGFVRHIRYVITVR